MIDFSNQKSSSKPSSDSASNKQHGNNIDELEKQISSLRTEVSKVL